MPVSSLQAAILSLITTGLSIFVGFGVVNNALAGTITAVAGTAVAAVFQIATELHRKSETVATVATVSARRS